MRREKVQFENQDGELLAAALERPRGVPRACALFAHCFTCTKDVITASRISRALVEHGIAVLRFDFTGLGDSEGDFANTNFSSNIQDLLSAAEFMQRRDMPVEILIGHSLGGAAVLAAARSIPEARAIATIAAPSNPKHARRYLRSSIAEIERNGSAEVMLAGRPFRIKKQFLDDLERHDVRKDIASLDKALLVLHSPFDQIVGIDEARKLFENARHPKSFVSLDSADHLLTNREDAEYVGAIISSWVSRYLPERRDEEVVKDDLRPGEVQVQTFHGKFAQTIAAGSHLFVSDEPTRVGGNDEGPAPYPLLLASLGSCTSMTMKLYAQRKKWPLEHVSVRLRHSRVNARECPKCEAKEGTVDVIYRTIVLRGPLDEAQRARLLQIADRCPIHRTLRRRPEIITDLDDS